MFDPAANSNSALLITEQLLVFAVFVGSVAALPAFIEFVSEVRKRKERIDLSLEDEVASSLRPRVAGMDDLLTNIADLIDRARNPSAYQDLKIGNEVLIIGPNQTGKKSLAQKIAQLAGMDRVVTVFNPRDSDALAKAKSLVRGYKGRKVMLLCRIDLAYQQGDPEVLTELDALIETTSERQMFGGRHHRGLRGQQRSGQSLRHQAGAPGGQGWQSSSRRDTRGCAANACRCDHLLSQRGEAARVPPGGHR